MTYAANMPSLIIPFDYAQDRLYYRWKSKFGGMEVSETKRLKALEEENRQLKQLLAEKELDNLGLRTALSKKY